MDDVNCLTNNKILTAVLHLYLQEIKKTALNKAILSLLDTGEVMDQSEITDFHLLRQRVGQDHYQDRSLVE